MYIFTLISSFKKSKAVTIDDFLESYSYTHTDTDAAILILVLKDLMNIFVGTIY